MNLDDMPAVMCKKLGVVSKRKRIYVALAPKEQENVEENIINKFKGHTKMFHADLGGVLLSFDKVEVRKKDLRDLPRWPLLYLPTEADFVLFHPRKGLELGCMVFRKEDTFIECLFLGLFSVNVSKPVWEKGWKGDRVELGMPVKVEIISVAYTLCNVPVMEGRLVETMEKEIKVDLVEEFQGIDAEDESEVKLCGRKIKRERDDEDDREERKRRKLEKKRKLNSGEGSVGLNFSNSTENLKNISVDGTVASIDQEILSQEELKRQRKKEKKRKKERKNKHLEEISVVELNLDKLPMEERKCEGKDDVLNHEVGDLATMERRLELRNEKNPIMPSSEVDIMPTEKLGVDNGRKHKKRKKQKDKESKRHRIYLVPEASSEMDCGQQKDSSKNTLSISGNGVAAESPGLQQFEKESKKQKREKQRKLQEANTQQVVIEELGEAGDNVNEELSDAGSDISRTTTIDGYTFVEHSKEITDIAKEGVIESIQFEAVDESFRSSPKDGSKSQQRSSLSEENDGNHSRKEFKGIKCIEMTLPYTSSFGSNSASEEEEEDNAENTNDSRHSTLKERTNLKSTSSCNNNKEEKNPKKSEDIKVISGEGNEQEMSKEDTKSELNLKYKSSYGSNNDVKQKPNKSDNVFRSSCEEEEISEYQDSEEGGDNLKSKSMLVSNNDKERRSKKVEDTSSSSVQGGDERSNSRGKTKRLSRKSKSSDCSSQEEEKSKLRDRKERSNLKSVSSRESKNEEQSAEKMVSTSGNLKEKKETSKDNDIGKSNLKLSSNDVEQQMPTKPEEHADLTPEIEHADLTPLNSKLLYKKQGNNEKPSMSNNFHLPKSWSVTSRGVGKSLKYTYHSTDGLKFTNFKKAHEHEAEIKSTRVEEPASPTRTSSEGNASDQPASEFVDSTSSVNMHRTVPKVSENKILETKLSKKAMTASTLSEKTTSKSNVSENATSEPKESEKNISEAEVTKKISKSKASNIGTSEAKVSEKEMSKSKGSKKITSQPKISEKAASEVNVSKTANNSSKNPPYSQNNASVRDHEMEVVSPRKEKKSHQFSSTVLPTPNFSTSTSVKTHFEKLLFGYDKMEGNSVQLDGISPILKPGSKLFEKLSKVTEPNLEESVLKSLIKPKKLKKNKKRKSEPGFL